MALRAESRFQIGTYKSIVSLFRNDRLGRGRSGLCLEVMSGLARSIMRAGFLRVVPNVPHWPAVFAPVTEQTGNLSLGERIVSSPPTRVIDRFLKIHQQKDGAGRREQNSHV